MHRIPWWLLALVLLLFLTSPCDAAYYRRGYGYSPAARANSMARVIRSQGAAEKMDSQARINNEEARSKFLDNQRKWTETYYARKDMIAQNKVKEFEETKNKVQNYIQNRKPDSPARLGPDELDPSTGQISWPDGLTDGEFGELRKAIEKLFVLRSQTRATGKMKTDITSAINSLRTEMRKRISTMVTTDYLASRKFLDRLANEGNQSPN